MSSKMLPPAIDDFIHSFYGYGNLAGKFWFIGMEEGGGDTEAEVSRRLQAWRELGCPETTDVAEFHKRIGFDYFFREPVKLQHTWAHLIRLLLALKGRAADAEAVKAYQKSRLGRQGEETCSLELLPLPAPTTRTWLYSDWSELQYLQSRRLYRRACRPWRAEHLRQLVKKWQPTVVVCYGLVYRKWYEIVAEAPFINRAKCSWAWVSRSNTLFVLVKHPAARGTSNHYFEQIGRNIRQLR